MLHDTREVHRFRRNMTGALERRQSRNRAPLNTYAEFKQQGTGYFKVRLLDLSPTGFRLLTVGQLHLDRVLYVKLPGLAPLKGSIKWHKGNEYGCAFEQALHDSVFDHIVRLCRS